jgi:putative transposase
METKSGKETHGLGIFSSIYSKSLPGLCFLNLSLLSVKRRTSYPTITEQLVRGDIQKSAPKAIKPKNSKPGRPKGNVRAVLTLIGLDVNVAYFVYDGALGNNVRLQAIKRTGLHLICKLRCDSTLYFPYTGINRGSMLD